MYNLILMFVFPNRALIIVGEPIMTATYSVISSRLILGLHKFVNTNEFSTESEDIEMYGNTRLRSRLVFASGSSTTDSTTRTDTAITAP
ncbi:hypothetical protein JAAARDRAFT_30264 [Jaapia argillacea MUCL 33604]|uniref:Uncharacterized protein n=1 Tax=Jaapia argillacea MUCL 33604 TaxID=933084 RepID=A0A067QID0_9AGAM|nr:hypothetical protein JAAARDRAFT_30264 [Jaapia argillacea MUCL 33604]